MDPSLSSPGWTTGEPLFSSTISPLDLFSSTTSTTVHPSQLDLTTTSHPHDTHTTTSNYSLPTSAAAEAFNNLLLVDQSEDYKRTAELQDIGPPKYVNGPSPPPPPPLMFDITICNTTGMASMSIAQQLQQQQQIVELDSEPHVSGAAASQQPSRFGWGIVETAGLLLDDMCSSTASSSRVSSTDDSWIEQFLQQNQPSLPSVPAEIRQQQPEKQTYPQDHQQQGHQQQQKMLQEQWLRQQQQQQYSQTTASTPDHLQPQHSMWSWVSFDQQQQISSFQHNLHLEYPISSIHHIPHTMPIDYLQQQQHCPPLPSPSPSSSLSSSFKQHQHLLFQFDTVEHPYNQQQQQPDPLQQYHNLRRRSSNHHQHHHYPQHHYLHQMPVIQSLKRRRRLTTEESEFLMGQFSLNGRPTAQDRDSFARHLKLDRRTIQVWFQNRRAKLKRDERGGGGQDGSTGGGGGGCEGDDDELEEGDFEDGTAVLQEASKDTNVGQELGYQQQTIHQQHTGDDILQLFPQQQYVSIAPPPPPPSFDVLDVEGKGSGESDDFGLDFLQSWNNNNEANYTTTTIDSNSNSNSNSNRGEITMGTGLAETARLGMELFSGQHFQYFQLQQQQQQLQAAVRDPDLRHPLQRWCLPLADSASFRYYSP